MPLRCTSRTSPRPIGRSDGTSPSWTTTISATARSAAPRVRPRPRTGEKPEAHVIPSIERTMILARPTWENPRLHLLDDVWLLTIAAVLVATGLPWYVN